jgi:hypothetical protein
MHGGIPFVGSLGTEIDRNLFGVGTRERLLATALICYSQGLYTRPCRHTCKDPDRMTLLHSEGNQFGSLQVFQVPCLRCVYPYAFLPGSDTLLLCNGQERVFSNS